MSTKLSDRISGFMPGISMDCVVFGYLSETLHILLLKFKDCDAWALPGGFLPIDMEMDAMVTTILKERTGVSDIYLEQFRTFSGKSRKWDANLLSKTTLDRVLNQFDTSEKAVLEPWFKQRFISTAYMALVNGEQVVAQPDRVSERCIWVPVDDLPPLILDHNEIIKEALLFLRKRLNYLPIGRALLPEKFTMKALLKLYEAILGRSLDRGNFQRKMMRLKVLQRHEKLMRGAQNKAPYLYSIVDEVYDSLLEQGVEFN